MSKPFIFGVATAGANFTDREQETKRLLANFHNGINTILISPRRWGKTSLVKKVCKIAESEKLKIESAYWIAYICERFAATGKSICKELAERICSTVDNHSSYVQQLAWLVWIQTDKIASQENFTSALQDLLDQNSVLFQRETENLSAYQMNFLKALVQGVNSEFSSQEILSTYNLGTSANITTIKKALTKNELIEIENKKVNLSDPVFSLWFKRDIMR